MTFSMSYKIMKTEWYKLNLGNKKIIYCKTVEGLLYLNEPIKTVQFHPEANAGPKDSELLFDEFMKMMSK